MTSSKEQKRKEKKVTRFSSAEFFFGRYNDDTSRIIYIFKLSQV